MKYPRKSPYLICTRINKDEYQLENFFDPERYYVNYRTADFLQHLDGRHSPYGLLPDCSRDSVRQLVQDLDYCNLLAPKNRITRLGCGSFLYSLFYCYPQKKNKIFAVFLNLILMLLFLPMSVVGIIMQSRGPEQIIMQSKAELCIAMLAGILSGAILHELAHICAGITYNGHLFEIGIGTYCFAPMAYVLLDDSNVKSRLKRFQINAAGIEMNLLLYGIFMCLAATDVFNPFVMKLCGTINLLMAVINALPLKNLDGIKVLSVITGKKDVLAYARRLVKHRKMLLRMPGCNAGRVAVIIASYGLVVFQIVLPAMLVFECISIGRLIIYGL